MEEVVLKPKWSCFNIGNSSIISDFFSVEKIDPDVKDFSLDLLRNYYRKDRIKGSNLIEELALRGYIFNTHKNSSFLPSEINSKKIIRIKNHNKDCYKKINFDILGLGEIIQKFNVNSDLFFDYIPLEGFVVLNRNISIDMVRNEFVNAGFVVDSVGSNSNINLIDIINLNHLNKLSDVFIKSSILNIEDLSQNFDHIVSSIPNLNKYDIKKLELIMEWFDSNYSIKDLRDITITDYFNFKNTKFERFCLKKKYIKVIDLLTDLEIYNFDKDIIIYYETYLAYLKTYYYLNVDPEIGNVELINIPNIGTKNTIKTLGENGIKNVKELLKADLYNLDGIGKGKIITIENSVFDFIRNPNSTISTSIIQESLYDIRIADLFNEGTLSSFVDYCEKNKFVYIRDFADKDLISILNNIKSLGKTKIKEIIKKLSDKKYNSVSANELVKILFDEAIEKNVDLYTVVFERIVNNRTLEDIGKDKNLTRERIRQQEAKGIRIIKSISNILYDIVLKNKEYIYIDENVINNIINDKNKSKIIFELLKDRDEFYKREDFHKIFVVDNFPECGEFFSEIDSFLSGNDEDCKDFMSIDEFYGQIEKIIKKYYLDKLITIEDFNTMIEKCNYKRDGNIFKKKGIYSHDIFSDILKEYFPNGMIFNEENCEIMKRKYFEITGEKSDLSVRNLTAKLQREKDVIICGSNTYIHIDNVKIDNNLLEVIHKYVLHLFEHEGLPSVYSDKIYSVFKNELNNCGIDNYSFIYGILRYYYPDDFIYDNFWIAKNGNMGVTRDLALVDYLKNDTNYNEGIPKEKIISLFGLSGPFLFNLIVNSSEINECHNKENLIYHDNYRLSDKLYEKIKEYIDSNIDAQYGYISLKHLLNKFNIYLEEEKIIDEYTLGNVLKKYLANYYIIELYVCKEKTDNTLDEDFFFDLYTDKNVTITRNGFEKYAEEKGIYANRIYDVLKNRFNELYQINISDFRKNINITSKAISDIYSIIDKNIEGKDYVPLSDLKKNGDLYKMPDIELSWNEYLLRSILLKNPNDKYIIIDIPGLMLYTEKGIIVRKELTVDNYIDFLVHVYNENKYYLFDSVNQLYKEFQAKGLIGDTLPNEFRKIVTDEYGRLRRC